MTLDEAIKDAEKIAEENQRVVDTGIVFDDVTIDMLYCDDTEVIEEHLANYQRCAEEHRQFAEWLKDYKQLRDQSRWVPVEKALPDDYGKDWVLAQIQEPDTGYLWIPCVSEYRKSKDDWYSDACGLGWLKDHKGEFKVIAWMPLPEPYKAEKEEPHGRTN